jgi:hypothetical protein
MKVMPITMKKFEGGKLHSSVEEEMLSFLKDRKDGAFTSQEIMAGIRYPTDFSTPEISKMSTFTIAYFTTVLHDLVNRGIIRMKVISNRIYFTVAADRHKAKCPKCKITREPTKTWKMTGRPDKRGKRFQLQIGLFKCPKHGTFRKVLDKRKV